jgi:hypothetical protein
MNPAEEKDDTPWLGFLTSLGIVGFLLLLILRSFLAPYLRRLTRLPPRMPPPRYVKVKKQ